MLKPYLQRIVAGESLDEATMQAAVGHIMEGAASPVQIAAFLLALRMRGETVDEITGAARAMRQHMTPVPTQRRPLLDTCGTGGDGAQTFNISTCVAFVCAASGVAVAKHGNRAVSSRSGSADVLQSLGVNIMASPALVQECISELGIGFLFAPSLHPAMKHAGPVRHELGVRTLFNVLGPLTNPAGATCQVLGVYDKALLAPLATVLGRLGSTRAWVVHGEDGIDELSTIDVTHVAEYNHGNVTRFTLDSRDAGVARATAEELAGGDATHNAAILRGILRGEITGAPADAVALNAGAGLLVAGRVATLAAGVAQARAALVSGAGARVLERLVAKTNETV